MQKQVIQTFNAKLIQKLHRIRTLSKIHVPAKIIDASESNEEGTLFIGYSAGLAKIVTAIADEYN